MVKVEGKYGISATIVLDSISEQGVRLTTFELEYPRLILAELNTHRNLSKNSASSRAIPFAKMMEQLNGRPVRFGQANPGMQDKGEDYIATVFVHRYMVEAFRHWLTNTVPVEQHDTRWDEEAYGYWTTAENWWKFSGWLATGCSEMFFEADYHKQVYNRLTEPFQMMKTVMTGTEFNNFFWLRDDGAADPTIAELARVMREARAQSTPTLLQAGEWHLPYVGFFRDGSGGAMYRISDGVAGDGTTYGFVSLDDAIKVSAARSAAVSFRNVDYGLEKCREVHARLVGDDRKHSSAMEHQATPMHKTPLSGENWINSACFADTWELGISHADRDGQLWSGNFRGWRQYRKLIAGENIAG